MMRMPSIAAVLSGLLSSIVIPAGAATLEQLSLQQMAQKSTAIVRVRVLSGTGVQRGADIYTIYQLQVLETWKGAGSPAVAVPGGAANGLRQMAPGSPTLQSGDEYVIFLWTGRSGLTQIIGLSQGLFSIKQDAAGHATVSRPAAGELMLDAEGQAVHDQAVSLKLPELKAQVIRALAGGK